MRYIGNKTKLLGFIGDLLDDKRIQPRRAFDAFSGTAAVGRFLKARGAAVASCDLMAFSYAFQRAYIVADRYPRFTALADDPDLRSVRARPEFAARVDHRVQRRRQSLPAMRPRESAPAESRALDEILVYLDSYLDPLTSFISRHFAAMDPQPVEDALPLFAREPAAADAAEFATLATSGRMYFALDRARRIDAIRERINDWRVGGALADDEFYLLLAALLEAADAVANTTGIYAAYIKQWQPNALRDLRLRLPAIVPRPRGSARTRCEAFLGDVSRIAPRAGRFDLLYLDPPYNTRQYSAYYHVPEIIARGWFDGPLVLRGKTGLPDGGAKSAWSTRAHCVCALERLIDTVDADHIVLSYNSEGIISDADIKRIFCRVGRRGSFVRVARDYQRYRSDSPGPARQYKAHSVREQLYYVRTKPRRARANA